MTSLILVDDDEDIVDTLAQLMELDGYEVLGKAYNGKGAVELYKQRKPDVVILDMKMPEYDGMYAIENIKKENADAKIISLSGYVNDDFIETETLRFLPKPCSLEELKAVIENLTSPQLTTNEIMLVEKS